MKVCLSLFLLLQAVCLVFQGYSEHFLSLFSDRVPNCVNAKRSISGPCAAPRHPQMDINKPCSVQHLLSNQFHFFSLSIPSNPPYLALHPPFRFLSLVLFPLSVNNSCLPHTHVHTQAIVAVSGFPQGLVQLYSRLCGFSKILIRTQCRCEHPCCCLTTNCLPQQNTHKHKHTHSCTQTKQRVESDTDTRQETFTSMHMHTQSVLIVLIYAHTHFPTSQTHTHYQT